MNPRRWFRVSLVADPAALTAMLAEDISPPLNSEPGTLNLEP
jgi:hypothetical protein